jgi:HAD superfamily hydrolase (TIGR01549 family)
VNDPHRTVFLLDVDNTLLDNDTIERHLQQHLEEAFGRASQERYWEIFEQLRAELGYADYLGALQRYRVEHPRDPHLLEVSAFLIEYPLLTASIPARLMSSNASIRRA